MKGSGGYISVIVTFVIFIGLGKWNPRRLQSKDASGKYTGCPNVWYHALIAGLVGLIVNWGIHYSGLEKKLKSS